MNQQFYKASGMFLMCSISTNLKYSTTLMYLLRVIYLLLSKQTLRARDQTRNKMKLIRAGNKFEQSRGTTLLEKD